MNISRPSRIIAPGMLLYEYCADDDDYKLVGVIDTTCDYGEHEECEFINSGKVINQVMLIEKNSSRETK